MGSNPFQEQRTLWNNQGMRKTTIECDQCGRDITSTYPKFTYELCAHNGRNTSNFSYSTEFVPEVKDGEFCSVDCLCAWIEAARARRATDPFRRPATGLIHTTAEDVQKQIVH